MVTAKMQKAKTDPVRVIRELQLLAEGSIDTAEDVIERLRSLEKELLTPLYPRYVIRGQSPLKPKNPILHQGVQSYENDS